jgi:hydroxymethylbilane synthase
MKNLSKAILTGTRDSRLSLAQTRQAIEQLCEIFPFLKFEIVSMSTPGDRDKAADLRLAPGDFFTRDLDEAALDGRIDCAAHSAKDLPEELPAGMDLLYLPWTEDPRDALILPEGISGIPEAPRIGVSSARREDYCRRRFPNAAMLSARGNVDQRIEQLDKGSYDLLIMAAAGLNRIGMAGRISEYIPLDELATPPGQGHLAVTFRKGDSRFNQLRKLFVKPVIFAGAGAGTMDNVTLGTINALKHCDICFYDAICPAGLLELLPANAEKVDVGKRKGRHAFSQQDISRKLVDAARRGLNAVRLKGGDPGIFGHLAEETCLLDEYELPYRALPGVSSLNAATTSSGLLLTRRGLSRGFTAAAPRKSGSEKIEWFSAVEQQAFPKVFFMAASGISEVMEALQAEEYPVSLPVSVVFDAGGDEELIISGALADIAAKVPDCSLPGIVIAGAAADGKFLFPKHGALGGMRVLFAGSAALSEKAKTAILNFDGRPALRPMIELIPAANAPEALAKAAGADWLIVTSPSAAQILLDAARLVKFDLRQLPSLAVCGPGTAEKFISHGIYPEVCASENFGTQGLLDALQGKIRREHTVLRLRSGLAGEKLNEQLRAMAAAVTDFVLYANQPAHCDKLPPFDAALFTSVSSATAFFESFAPSTLENKIICAIGNPAASKLKELLPGAEIVQGSEATVESMIYALAVKQISSKLGEQNSVE